MKPAAFDFIRPDTLEEALGVLDDDGENTRVIAGGQSLTAMLNMRLASPSQLVDISRLKCLRRIEIKNDMVEVGAGVTQDELLKWPGLQEAQPLLTQVLPWVGHYQTRQRGTVCGSLAHSDPSAELPLALATLDGEVLVQNRRRKRTVKARDFQTGMMATSVEADEMIVACRFPIAPAQAVTRFREINQRHGDFALVAVAAIGSRKGVRLGVGGVAEVPATVDLPWLPEAELQEALNAFAWELGGVDDHHASARYRRGLVRRIGQDLIHEVSDASP